MTSEKSALPTTEPATEASSGPLLGLLRSTRPRHWVKSGFVVLGPLYGYAFGTLVDPLGLVGIVLAFGFASSAGYVFNDLQDRTVDRAHPRKGLRPLAAGLVSPRAGWALFVGLLFLAGAALLLIPAGRGQQLAGGALGLYLINSLAYSFKLKHVVLLDAISLAVGFVLRVLGGCAAVLVVPSTWLLDCTFFLALFLAFGKRLGERRTSEGEPSAVRPVQAHYSDELLRVIVVVTAVAALGLYAAYVQSREPRELVAVNLLWLTVVPATYALLRAVLLLERGEYDDPTEMATRDGPILLATLAFVLVSAGALFGERLL